MARFLHGLNREIQDVIELHHYHSLENLVHKATKVDMQLKKKLMSRKSSYPSDSGNGRAKWSLRKDKSLEKRRERLEG
ncbi:hypothetical protein CR513_20142, partial [Mucuna pruriens]